MEKWLATSRFNCWQPATTRFWQLERPTREVCTLSSNPMAAITSSQQATRPTSPIWQASTSGKHFQGAHLWVLATERLKLGRGMMSNHSCPIFADDVQGS